jgi:hypothetical protein
MKSFLAAIHNAVAGPVEEALDESEPGATALNPTQTGGKMSTDNQPGGGIPASAGISQATHEAAVATARNEGKAEGEKLAADRLVAAMSADGVKGDAGRMSAALDLASKSPAMSGNDVAAFVVANVSASAAAPVSAAATYSSARVEAAGLAQPSASASKKNNIDTNGIYASRRKQS